MTGTEVLKVKPNTTDAAAARPAVRARSFCEATSPTKDQPRVPTEHRQSANYRRPCSDVADLRAALNSDHTQATKIRKFLSGLVASTCPKMPTIIIVVVQMIADAMTMLRRPNLSVPMIRQTLVTTARIALQKSFVSFCRLVIDKPGTHL